MDKISQNLSQLTKQIRQQNPNVKLLAVSKGQSVENIIAAYQAGQRDFAESYLQQALEKQQLLADLQITWHFIGPIQSNKTKQIAENFTWVHSIDRLKIAQRLSAQRPNHLPPLNILIQVNISRESSKSGIPLAALADMANALQPLPNLNLRGVMAIPAPNNLADQCQPYRLLYNAVQQLNTQNLDEFSFGMSADFTSAIAQGATMVRIGTGIFGKR